MRQKKTKLLKPSNNDLKTDLYKNVAFSNDYQILPIEIFIDINNDYYNDLTNNSSLDKSTNNYLEQKLQYDYDYQKINIANSKTKLEIPIWRRTPPNFIKSSLPPQPLLPYPFSILTTAMPFKKTLKNDLKNNLIFDKNLLKDNKNLFLTNQERKKYPTIVTALFDIGRGNWIRFTRPFDIYLKYFNKIFRLDNFIIIYCEKKVINYIYGQLKNDLHPLSIKFERLQIVEINFKDLPLYRYRDEIQIILNNEQKNWLSNWDPQTKSHPEALYAEYNILVNSKAYFLQNATHITKFFKNNSNFFVWLDAGYGRESQTTIPIGIWNPKLPLHHITLIQLTTFMDQIEKYTIEMVYRKQRSVVSGGFLAGDVTTIQRFYKYFYKTFIDHLNLKKIDDDQTTLLITISKYRNIFNILYGGWFDAFKLLPSQF